MRGRTVTRGRPYQHNDNAHIEQRNGDWVRKHAFRHRYETDAELGHISIDSPLARAALKKRVDDEFSAELPSGRYDFIIVGVCYDA